MKVLWRIVEALRHGDDDGHQKHTAIRNVCKLSDTLPSTRLNEEVYTEVDKEAN